jgi:hypothetical protein
VFLTLLLKIDQAGFWECPMTYKIEANIDDSKGDSDVKTEE